GAAASVGGEGRILARLPIVTGWGDTSVSIAEEVAWTSTDSRVVAMDLAVPGAVPCVLEASAAVIWTEIAEAGPIDVAELLERVSDVFDMDVDVIRDGVESLVDELIERQLLAA